jgi:hypothetical protein
MMRRLNVHGRGLAVGTALLPIVPEAVLFDHWRGDTRIRPGADPGC